MTETLKDIRASLLTTLAFLASERQQREFAAKVPYASYQGEFACWWFDTFFPDEPEALEMFDLKQLDALRHFSAAFDSCLQAVGNGELSIESLLALDEWQTLISRAQQTLVEVQDAI